MFVIQYSGYVIGGLSLGIIIDIIFKYIKSKLLLFNNQKFTEGLILLLQLILNGIILYILMIYEFHHGIINTMPGIIFPVLLFGIQDNIYTTVQDFLYR